MNRGWLISVAALVALSGCTGVPTTSKGVNSTSPSANGTGVGTAEISTPTKNTIPPGTWLVPSEVEPGTYRSAGVEEGIFEYCQVTTYNASGTLLEWKNVGEAGAPLVVKVSKNAATVENSGCATFTKVGQ